LGECHLITGQTDTRSIGRRGRCMCVFADATAEKKNPATRTKVAGHRW